MKNAVAKWVAIAIAVILMLAVAAGAFFTLEDVNLSRTFADPEPVKKMTWLKNLWCMERGNGVVYEWTQALPNTHVVGIGTDAIGYGWRKLPNYYKMRDALDMYYMD